MIIVTFSDREEQVVEKIKAVLAEDQEIECIPIAEGKEMVFGDTDKAKTGFSKRKRSGIDHKGI